ncbi:GNAT family N-acetyltransferase [Kaistella jeonii]|uniref:GNAT family acetyltransferase n=1 Tax=Kaistella jeonii TaxID=266749 RepID=A0A0C1FE22_9FLAO|nr:GNAT family N-acetyltransferase [Kaistella jeonii]KIA90073.1 GNAT family acetyltransferase [Kaistella jeonii]SFB78201.1 ElaA protein [Kaistella jeonii]VEI96347.1 putative acyltransferase [Kaistella jeonii]
MINIVWKIKSFEELSTKELYEILKIRQEVFVVEQTCYYLDADGYDTKAAHIWAEKGDQILAYCRIFKPGIKYTEASIGRVLTNPSYRNLKLGKILIKIAINTIEGKFRTHNIRISAQDYLLKFYSDFGFRVTENNYFEDDIPHTEMVKYSE